MKLRVESRLHPHDWPFRLGDRLVKVMAVADDVATVLRRLHELQIGGAGEDADTVDKRHAGREELLGVREQAPLVVVADRAVVGAVHLHPP